MTEAVPGQDDAASAAARSMHMGFNFELSDHGDDAIQIEFPDEADTVDITEAYREAARNLLGSCPPRADGLRYSSWARIRSRP